MLCYFCSSENHELALFCRNCLALLDPYAETPEYLNENFNKIRELAVQVYEQTISLPEYQEALADFYRLVGRSLEELEQGIARVQNDAGDDRSWEDEVGGQVHQTRQGLNLYLEGLEILAGYDGAPEKDRLQAGLEKLEEGNHLLNQAVLSLEEEGDSSVFLDQIS